MPDGTPHDSASHAAPPTPHPAARPDGKFADQARTATGEQRAAVALRGLETLWVNTGTLCNIACTGCYIHSGPKNDALAYITPDDLRPYLDEIAADRLGTREIGFTGGEPFMNPHILTLLEDCLERGFDVLVLTNAMKPMTHRRPGLRDLRARFGGRLGVRVSLDHYTRDRHEALRGPGTWDAALDGLAWLAAEGFAPSIAGRTLWGEPEDNERAGYADLLAGLGMAVDTRDPHRLVLFPEMDETADVPEITERCWGLLGKTPDSVMCASARMVVRRKGADRPAVLACTLLAYDPQFELGPTLADAAGPVALNHPHCARFCVLGGASCSG